MEPEPTVNMNLGESGSLHTDESMQNLQGSHASPHDMNAASTYRLASQTLRTSNMAQVTQNPPSPTDAQQVALGTPNSQNRSTDLLCEDNSEMPVQLQRSRTQLERDTEGLQQPSSGETPSVPDKGSHERRPRKERRASMSEEAEAQMNSSHRQ